MDHKSHIDPVCGMRVDKKDAAGEYEHDGVMYYFDSDECMKQFFERPEQYTDKPKNEDAAETIRQS